MSRRRACGCCATGSPRCAPISSPTSCSPAASPIERGLTFHIRERRPNGLLVGIFIDDRRDPTERVTILAEHGEIVKNDNGTLPGAAKTAASSGSRAKQRDPNIVKFERYAFDLSQFTGGTPGRQILGARALPLGADRRPTRTIRCTSEQPGQFRAELHDRLLAPLYPIAFVADRLRLSRRAAHHPAERAPGRSPRSSLGVAGLAPDRLCLHGRSRVQISDRRRWFSIVALVGAMAASLFAISRGADHRAAGVPDQGCRPPSPNVRAPHRRDRGAGAMITHALTAISACASSPRWSRCSSASSR